MFNADSLAVSESETITVDAGREHSESSQVTNEDSLQHRTEGPGASQFIAPVNQLPDEILTRIFGYATAPSSHGVLFIGVIAHAALLFIGDLFVVRSPFHSPTPATLIETRQDLQMLFNLGTPIQAHCIFYHPCPAQCG